jgi:hypothetical protein
MKAGKAWLGTLAVVAALVTYGCEDTGRAKEETREAAERAGEKVESGARGAGSEIDAAKQTFDIKAAFTADTSIDASHIDVDTNDDTKTVTLKGTVPTAAQKMGAERIAREKAEGYTVVNELTVTARP